ncbi:MULTISPECIES: RNA polymerase sigma factor [Olivibacter]|uniref:RNA polymerase, sigma-24 subunit, ECF subfamily n=2 Tax=Sphingobacteriaceae TaxID=84566 RepID=F4CD46_SPHS2|nr:MULTISPECIES: sigma-70 family RNA polymerase sigma factor [Olivibacter]MDM8177721.1 sigma-70 family RNA polymerase sigma factor [Olivibacter sp. 47]
MEVSYSDPHEDLIADCKKGNRQAQFKLYKLYSKAMYNTALRIVIDADEAADVLQDAFIDAFKRLDSFRQESTFGLWMKQIVVNKSLSALRKRTVVFESISDIDDVADEEIEENNYSFQIEQVKEAINQLADGYRVVLSLYLLEGYDHEEIAHILKISENTSRTQFLRAKRKLLEILKN